MSRLTYPIDSAEFYRLLEGQVIDDFSRTLAGSIAYIVEADQTVQVFDDRGTLLFEQLWPAPGNKYVASGQRRGRKPKAI